MIAFDLLTEGGVYGVDAHPTIMAESRSPDKEQLCRSEQSSSRGSTRRGEWDVLVAVDVVAQQLLPDHDQYREEETGEQGLCGLVVILDEPGETFGGVAAALVVQHLVGVVQWRVQEGVDVVLVRELEHGSGGRRRCCCSCTCSSH